MVMFGLQDLGPGIDLYTNVSNGLNNLEIISDIEEAIELKAMEWLRPHIVVNGKSHVDTSVRDLDTLGIDYYQSRSIIERPSDIHESAKNIIGNKIFNVLDPIEKDYQSRYAISLQNHDIYSILKYGEGHFFNNHIDDYPGQKRTLSVLYYLNGDYDGGEISFPRFNITIKPKADSVLMFPSTYVYNHSVAKIKSGTRYAAVSWLS